MGRAEHITHHIKSHDHKLYCGKHETGVLCIFRESQRTETYDIDGDVIHFIRPAPHFVSALTHDWSLKGRPVDWGILPIMKRLDDLDLWKRDLVGEIEKNDSKKKEAEKRDLQNKSEDFLSDYRSTFKKAFADVNVSSLEKTDKRRVHEKRVKQ